MDKKQRQREFAHLVDRQMNLRHQLEHIEEKLNVYEQLQLQRAKYGTNSLYRLDIKRKVVDDFLNGDWQQTIELYKRVFHESYVIERRICELTNNHRDFY